MLHRQIRMVELAVVALLLTQLPACTEHTAWLGGADRDNVTENQTPPAALAVFRERHPHARVDRIVQIVSNSPTKYQIYYCEGENQRSEFWYSDLKPFSESRGIYPDAVWTSLKKIYPDDVIDQAEGLDDVARHSEFYRFHLKTPNGDTIVACFSKNGDRFEF